LKIRLMKEGIQVETVIQSIFGQQKKLMILSLEELPQRFELKVTSIKPVEGGFDLEVVTEAPIAPKSKTLPSGDIEYYTRSGRREIISAIPVRQVVDFLKREGKAPCKTIAQSLGISERYASRILVALCAVNRVRRIRKGRTFHYELTSYTDILPKEKALDPMPEDRPMVDVDVRNKGTARYLIEERKQKLKAEREA